jgi:hypothetical protein
MIKVRHIEDAELGWVNERYAEIGFASSTGSDFVVVAELDGMKAGVGRVVPVDAGAGELGGIHVLPKFRRHGVARAIVAHLIDHSPCGRLFCIPFAHLEHFYAGFGFVPVTPNTVVPQAIAGRRRWCEERYRETGRLMVCEGR